MIYGGVYEKKKNGNTLCQRIMMFVVNNAHIHQSGQGVIGIDCPNLWEMTDKEFEETFTVKLKEVRS